MDISLVIPTRNRAAQLVDLFPHLGRLQTSAAWEIVIVDNGSTDGTAEVLSRFAGPPGVRTTVLGEPKLGATVARNTGWRATSGAIVAFLDDDCYPAPDFLDRIRSCISRDDLGFVGGRVLLYDAADAPVSIQPRNHRVDIPPRSFLPPGFILGANVAFRREVLERLGGFDEKLGPGRLYGADDDDLVARASALGITGAYDPAPVVFHHHRRSKPEEVRALLAGYDMARGAFYAKMLWNPQTRGIYLWPALRRTAGSIRRRDFAVMAREFSGARKYFGS